MGFAACRQAREGAAALARAASMRFPNRKDRQVMRKAAAVLAQGARTDLATDRRTAFAFSVPFRGRPRAGAIGQAARAAAAVREGRRMARALVADFGQAGQPCFARKVRLRAAIARPLPFPPLSTPLPTDPVRCPLCRYREARRKSGKQLRRRIISRRNGCNTCCIPPGCALKWLDSCDLGGFLSSGAAVFVGKGGADKLA